MPVVKKRSFLLATAAVLAGTAARAYDPLDVPAKASPLAQRRLITAVTRAGDRAVVAVGQRGHILRSMDAGRSWMQSPVPVSSDLTSVRFVDAQVGYAVGQDGVVLGSRDGGAHWERLLDGRTANQRLLNHMTERAAVGTEEDRRLQEEARRNLELGPDKPFLDLWFTSASEGFVVGAYNLVFHTVDAGRTWEPWYDRIENPGLLSLYGIGSAGGALYVAGEAGLLLRLDAAAGRFRALPSPYRGSFFGVLGTPAGVLVFGMRGNAFLSRDAGQTWRPVATGLVASITAGDVRADGRVALVDQAGGLALSLDGGETFSRVAVEPPMPLSAVTLAADVAVLGGTRGPLSIELPKHK